MDGGCVRGETNEMSETMAMGNKALYLHWGGRFFFFLCCVCMHACFFFGMGQGNEMAIII